MQLFLYNIFLLLYTTAIRIVSLFNDKAKKWVRGRRDIIQTIKATLPHNEKRIWIHCASLGEFEQGRPLIEAIRVRYPQYKILLTFFSPSGYELRKNYEHADYVFYLPMDGRRRSARFVRAVNPSLVIFVKYEFWYYYICNLEELNIPAILVSGAFRPSQPFFKWYGSLFRRMLRKMSFFFVQDEDSKRLLNSIGISEPVAISGDTRYDRVAEIAEAAKTFPAVAQWKGSTKLVIAGSTWPDDEKILKALLDMIPPDWKMILAPHEIDNAHINDIKSRFGSEAVLYSGLTGSPGIGRSQGGAGRVLIIDNIGMLSSLFRYGEIAYIGGGFQKGGIHNTLEPAVFGLPVIFGPEYGKFVEARQLVAHGFGFPVQNAEECQEVFRRLSGDDETLRSKQSAIRTYVRQQTGATNLVLDIISDRYLRRP